MQNVTMCCLVRAIAGDRQVCGYGGLQLVERGGKGNQRVTYSYPCASLLTNNTTKQKHIPILPLKE